MIDLKPLDELFEEYEEELEAADKADRIAEGMFGEGRLNNESIH